MFVKLITRAIAQKKMLCEYCSMSHGEIQAAYINKNSMHYICKLVECISQHFSLKQIPLIYRIKTKSTKQKKLTYNSHVLIYQLEYISYRCGFFYRRQNTNTHRVHYTHWWDIENTSTNGIKIKLPFYANYVRTTNINVCRRTTHTNNYSSILIDSYIWNVFFRFYYSILNPNNLILLSLSFPEIGKEQYLQRRKTKINMNITLWSTFIIIRKLLFCCVSRACLNITISNVLLLFYSLTRHFWVVIEYHIYIRLPFTTSNKKKKK